MSWIPKRQMSGSLRLCHVYFGYVTIQTVTYLYRWNNECLLSLHQASCRKHLRPLRDLRLAYKFYTEIIVLNKDFSFTLTQTVPTGVCTYCHEIQSLNGLGPNHWFWTNALVFLCKECSKCSSVSDPRISWLKSYRGVEIHCVFLMKSNKNSFNTSSRET